MADLCIELISVDCRRAERGPFLYAGLNCNAVIVMRSALLWQWLLIVETIVISLRGFYRRTCMQFIFTVITVTKQEKGSLNATPSHRHITSLCDARYASWVESDENSKDE